MASGRSERLRAWEYDDENIPNTSGFDQEIVSNNGLMFGQLDDYPDNTTLHEENAFHPPVFQVPNPFPSNTGYNLRTHRVLNPKFDLDEVHKQQKNKQQQSLAAVWSKVTRDIENEINSLKTNIYSTCDNQTVRRSLDRLLELWDTLEEVHPQYIQGIREAMRLQIVGERYRKLKCDTAHLIEEWRKLAINQQQIDDVDNVSLKSEVSRRSSSSSLSSQREKRRTMLLTKTKLEFAKSRQLEDAEMARSTYEMNAKKELRRLEEEAALAEIEWRVETECDQQTDGIKFSTPILQPSSNAAELPMTSPIYQHTTRYVNELCPPGHDANSFITRSDARRSPRNELCPPGHDANSVATRSDARSSARNERCPPGHDANSVATHSDARSSARNELCPPGHDANSVATRSDARSSARNELCPPGHDANSVATRSDARSSARNELCPPGHDANSVVNAQSNTRSPLDPLAAMFKIQLLNGITPTTFTGRPSEFPFFKAQVKSHLEEDQLLTDTQRLEYLPKFLAGEALEVLKRNRGCSYETIMKTLELRYGRPIQVAQHCIEELTNGPKINYGDNLALLNFSEKLYAATKVLKGDYETEISVATNMRKLVNRLPNDMISKWQHENYRITETGRCARLTDVATFVKKHAEIRNDPVFGTQKKDTKDTKQTERRFAPSLRKQSTLTSTSVDKEPANKTVNCEICGGSAHNLTRCPVIRRCDKVAVRRQYAASYGYCFNCGQARPGHSNVNCSHPPACKQCTAPHLDILHLDRKPTRNQTDGPKNTNKNDGSKNTNQTTNVTSAGVSTIRKTHVLLNILPVTITTEGGHAATTYAFLDNGCTDTLIDRELADHLNLKGSPENIEINTITNTRVDVRSERVAFSLSAADGSSPDLMVEEAYVLPTLNLTVPELPDEIDVSKHPHLDDLRFPQVDIRRVSIIVGTNVPLAHVQTEVRIPEGDGLFGFRHPLGWSIAGPVGPVGRRSQKLLLNCTALDRQLDDQVEKFWRLETNGTVKANETGLSEEDKRALRIIEETSQYSEGHYNVGLLWKHNNPELPCSRATAEKRLASLKRRLTNPNNADVATKYCEVMNDYITKGYARRLNSEDANRDGGRCWYLPHHPVTNPNKPGKVRIVFDAAAETKDTSLNKNLLQGPDMTNSLIGVLLRFRQGTVAFAADVEAMFHQVRVKSEDQDALRFLWWTNGFDQEPDVYVMQVHIFGATCSPCIANSALKRAATDNAEDFSPDAVTAVHQNFYVDDALVSTNDEGSAIQLASEMTEILDRGGFRLTNFTSSNKEVLSSIPKDRRANPNLNLDLDELPVERALGVRWWAETDELGFQVKDLGRPETKRGILSTVCSLYDPIGFAAPVILSAKTIVQDLWRSRVSWDQPLEPEHLQRWRGWKEVLPSLSTLRIPRSYFLPNMGDLSACQIGLHHFSDASEVGYGTVSYLRIKYPDGSIQCAFVTGKSRNTPLKFTSISRLELQAAVLSTRVNNMLQRELELPIQQTRYWTDSEIVLHYLKSKTRRFKTFVANRIEEIKENCVVDEWQHVPGTLNPADDASRGISPNDLTPTHRWLRGPEFLWHPESHWPNSNEVEFEVPADLLEVKDERKKHVNSNVILTQAESATTSSPSKIQQMINSCSDWTVLRRRVAWLQRFVKYIADRKGVPTGGLTVNDYTNAAIAITRNVQRSAYQREMTDLMTKGTVKATSKIVSLNPVLDTSGLLRCSGRARNVPTLSHRQIIIPRGHVAQLIVRFTHASIGHLGREHVLAKIRERYWIPQARVLIRSVLSRCVTCKKLNAKPIIQQMAPLPKDRVTAFEPPFCYTGMDLFGPMHVKHGRGTAKRWGCLFTCLNTRSVHLELVNSLDTDDFILCLRRFLNRRGDVTHLRCDRGTNFVGAERELREGLQHWNQAQIERELTQRGCKWIFQPPTASSMSGVWERLVRSTKNVIKATIGLQTLTDTALYTLLTEVERILNGRALTANSDSPDDLQALTPAHFLMQRKTMNLPPGLFDDKDIYHRRKWRQIQYLADVFWRRWLREYVPILQQRAKWLKVSPNLKTNALVLLVDHTTPRGRWLLGRVLETYPGPDGMVRTVKVKTKNSELVRPIQKLCLLEEDLTAAC